MPAEHKISRWEASATVAVDTNWFTNNIGPDVQQATPSKFTVQIMVPTSTVVEFDLTDGTTNKTGTVNNGGALVANSWQQFDLMVKGGWSFNIQHKTTTQNVACNIFESISNSDI